MQAVFAMQLYFHLSDISPGCLPESHQGWSLAQSECRQRRAAGQQKEAALVHRAQWRAQSPTLARAQTGHPPLLRTLLTEMHYIGIYPPTALAGFQTAQKKTTKKFKVYAVSTYYNSTLLIDFFLIRHQVNHSLRIFYFYFILFFAAQQKGQISGKWDRKLGGWGNELWKFRLVFWQVPMAGYDRNTENFLLPRLWNPRL